MTPNALRPLAALIAAATAVFAVAVANPASAKDDGRLNSTALSALATMQASAPKIEFHVQPVATTSAANARLALQLAESAPFSQMVEALAGEASFNTRIAIASQMTATQMPVVQNILSAQQTNTAENIQAMVNAMTQISSNLAADNANIPSMVQSFDQAMGAITSQ